MVENLTEDELSEMLEQASILEDGHICSRLELRQFAAVVAAKCIQLALVSDIVAYFTPPMGV